MANKKLDKTINLDGELYDIYAENGLYFIPKEDFTVVAGSSTSGQYLAAK